MGAPGMKRPVPPASGNRAKINRNENHHIGAGPEPEENFAVVWIAARFGLDLTLARTIAAIASLGRVFG